MQKIDLTKTELFAFNEKAQRLPDNVEYITKRMLIELEKKINEIIEKLNDISNSK